jgi:threonine/homoserine/homoserine lactone efflux protein
VIWVTATRRRGREARQKKEGRKKTKKVVVVGVVGEVLRPEVYFFFILAIPHFILDIYHI